MTSNEWQRYTAKKTKMGPITIILSKDSSPESSPNPSIMKYSNINNESWG